MITASMVKDLREKTGAGMLDCKKALEATSGDLDKAAEWLREKGEWQMYTFGFIGCGNMGGALATAVSKTEKNKKLFLIDLWVGLNHPIK